MLSKVVYPGEVQFLVVLPQQLVIFPELPCLGGRQRNTRGAQNFRKLPGIGFSAVSVWRHCGQNTSFAPGVSKTLRLNSYERRLLLSSIVADFLPGQSPAGSLQAGRSPGSGRRDRRNLTCSNWASSGSRMSIKSPAGFFSGWFTVSTDRLPESSFSAALPRPPQGSASNSARGRRKNII